MSPSTVPRSAPPRRPDRPDRSRRPAPRARRRPRAPRGERHLPEGGVRLRHRLRRDRTLILMTLPCVALLLVFAYLPIAGNVIAFQYFSPYAGDGFFESMANSAWVGLEQFERMVNDSYFWDAVQNTLVFSALQLIFFFPVPIALAILINSILHSKVRAWAQAVLYLPHFFSWVLVITVFQQVLGGAGMVAQTLRENGWDDGFDLMTDPGFFKFLITFQVIWKDAGWGIIVFLAALSTVNQELYESAAVDGAGRWRRIWHVTLPALRPVIALLLVLQVGNMLTVGMEQFMIQRTAVGPGAAEVLDTYVWNTGIENGQFSYAAAIGIVKGVFSLALVLAANRVAHAMGEQGVYRRT
ncbi:carbohydrate ABC transporter membrane protein 1, CUT1 family [Streptomyces zhaozhouensis]|uniref:Carbohydrate ABC transporter membrane protein 1, CUT1 family n=1 Tax=Streptomyces zhaozhouensis TaxID=1300267 RepID=A0A286E172_9ACTN|nr:ABC transporter permease subunit [Streptomyces zhaozhouensis]SOD64641.1 carbohydrate ABC transporter membrane protein 1, CUT1 family [Streptomyces zhaozhouensis]